MCQDFTSIICLIFGLSTNMWDRGWSRIEKGSSVPKFVMYMNVGVFSALEGIRKMLLLIIVTVIS